MKVPRIINAVGNIGDDLIEAAEKQNAKKRSVFVKYIPLTACLTILIISIAVILPMLSDNTESAPKENGRYKNFTASQESVAIIWPWEYLTSSEKYTTLTIDNITYNSKCRKISDSLTDIRIGLYTVEGYDHTNDKKYTIEAEAYTIKNVDKSQFVAVKIEDKYYVFKNSEYSPVKNYGELSDSINLPEIIELNRFSEKDSTPESSHYILDDDDYIWQVLSKCREAPFIEDQLWSASDRKYLSFTITSESLGIYKVAMYITSDGYLWTNAFSYQYLFYIGEESAEKIITYAKENSSPATYEPYANYVYGQITEITDDYILVDDSVLCKNPSDGIVYKILLNDLRISRYIDKSVAGSGDTVQILYDGKIDDENTIDSATSLSKVKISDGDLYILE